MTKIASRQLETAGTNGETNTQQIDVDLDLSELIAFHESIDWRTVPGISVAEAAAWTARLDKAREEVRADL